MHAFTSTRARLALVSTLVLAVALLAADIALLSSLGYAQRSYADALLASQADQVVSGLEDVNGVLALGSNAGEQDQGGVAVDSAVVTGQTVTARSGRASLPAAALVSVARRARASGSAFGDAVDARGVPYRLLARTLEGRSGAPVLVVSRPVADLEADLRLTGALLAAASLAVVAIGAGGSYWMAGRALRGVQQSFESLRRFTADASHELRAPLAQLRSELDVTLARPRSPGEYRSSLETMQAEVDHLARITDHLLLLARADARALVPAREPIDVADTLHEAAARWARTAREKRVRIAVDAPPSGTLSAEAALLRRVVDNLLDNAVRHSPPGGTVTLAGARSRDEWRIEVRDEGPGIAPEHRARLFTRFARPDPARTRDAGGAGLGLALSAAIAHAHGGRLDLVDDGTPGAAFRVVLPDA